MKQSLLVLASILGLASSAFAAADFDLSHKNLAPLTSVTVNGKLILADEKGLTVYVYDLDKAGVSNCNAGCAHEWPPVLVPAGATLAAPLGQIVRKNGTHQITYDGRPVYRYDDDKKSGTTLGDGDDGVWHIVVVGQ